MYKCDCCGSIRPCPICARKTKQCIDCGRPIYPTSIRCKHCAGKESYRLYIGPRPFKIEWPPLEQLEERIAVNGLAETARWLGVSRQAIAKHYRLRKTEQLERFLEEKV